MKPIRTLARPAAAGTLAAAVLVLSGAGSAKAATGTPAVPRAYSAGQLADARAVAGSDATLGVLRRFFAKAPGHDGAGTSRGAAQAAPRLTGASTTVYTLNADFVAGREGAPVAKPAFVASDALCADGRRASVWSVRTKRGWQVVNIATGTDETTYAAKAHGRGTVFREPQINAWYVLRGDRVLPLNTEARAAVGGHGTTVAGYRRHVHSSYGSRLAGSAYDREGYAGGFGESSVRAAAAAATDGRDSGTDAGTLAGLGTAGAALTLGAALVGRRLLKGPGVR
ncbi:hypothetical protein GCM10010503_59960 [Streptomyces lucensis JCM 4490]|uniref:Secreted protein n=1 Tax=Streptomyces lucensis JCM 4490 TaxID=1306176 RepID=A0A918JCB9_9ACTN|nr:hypothetical protein [Streptomyces lucensis]GGW74379.1 hypothetical protein GCM10010503_59960 [Streptomyces lucensis JCM 4490]